ncbi:MAG: tetratricopeptide repeat protein [Verrucomicrobiota bacterium]|nr:tetratricopeptide repeat protein [Verrucomicrobiota bacterium]
MAVALLALPGCHRAASKEERALRGELRKALDEQNYERAADLARRHLKFKPQDNGTWDRLVRAHFGLHDLAGVKQTLEDWRRSVPKPSRNLDEYAGDLASAQNDDARAIEAWQRVAAADPKNVRVLEKIARLEERQHFWTKEDAAWTALIAVRESANARINRALCRRRLHRWHDAFEDLEKAHALAPDDPEVERGAKVFEGIGRFLAEIRELDSALAISPNDPGLLADRALLFLRAEDPELALEDAEAAAKIGTWAVRPKLFQALALIALGRADECEKSGIHKLIRLERLAPEFLETMARLDSEVSAERNNGELYVSRAWQLNEIGQPSLALEDAQMAMTLDPKAAGAWAEASYALTKLGRAAEALEQIKRATELDPNFSTAWQYRGELEMARGETLSAVESFTHALEANQTATALEKREQCYRRLGLLVKAEQDRRARLELANDTK